MDPATPDVSPTLQAAHAELYTDAMTEWRKLGGDPDLTRFIGFRNQGLPRTLRREIALAFRPLRQWLRRRRLGNSRYREFGYDAYTCLAQARGRLRVFA